METQLNKPIPSTVVDPMWEAAGYPKEKYYVDYRLEKISDMGVYVEAYCQAEAEALAMLELEKRLPNCGCSGCPQYSVSINFSHLVEEAKGNE